MMDAPRKATECNPWHNPRSYAPNLYDQRSAVEYYEKLARRARREAVFAEIKDGLISCACGALAAMLLVVGVLYSGGVS